MVALKRKRHPKIRCLMESSSQSLSVVSLSTLSALRALATALSHHRQPGTSTLAHVAIEASELPLLAPSPAGCQSDKRLEYTSRSQLPLYNLSLPLFSFPFFPPSRLPPFPPILTLGTLEMMSEYPRMDPYARSRYEQGVDAKIVIMGNTGSCLSRAFHISPRLLIPSPVAHPLLPTSFPYHRRRQDQPVAQIYPK